MKGLLRALKRLARSSNSGFYCVRDEASKHSNIQTTEPRETTPLLYALCCRAFIELSDSSLTVLILGGVSGSAVWSLFLF